MNSTNFQNIPNYLSNKLLEYCTYLNELDNTEFKIIYNELEQCFNGGIELEFKWRDDYILIKYNHPNYQINLKTKEKDPFKKLNKFMNGLNKYDKMFYIFNDISINTIRYNENILFDLQQIEYILKYKKGYLIKYYLKRYNILVQKIGKYIYADKEGLKVILSRSRKPGCKSLMEQLDLDINTKKQCIEANVLESIIDYLDVRKIKYELQYPLGKYKIDMYIPKFNIVIEIDEMGHIDRNPKYEKERYKFIEKNLTKKIFRINPNVPKFRITKELGKISIMMK